jgi:glycosyltransferase involved in cell wall biosynthesis
LSIEYFPLGGDISASHPSVGLSKRVVGLLDRMRCRPTILMVGTVEPRKGYGPALAAFEHLWVADVQNGPDLVIVGKPGWKTSALQETLKSHAEAGRRLHWVATASDEELGMLYDACRGLLITSLGEGLGLPLIEAAIHGQPVLARGLRVFREQNLPNVVYFEDDRPEVLAPLLLDMLASGVRTPMCLDEMPTWHASTTRLLEALTLDLQRL